MSSKFHFFGEPLLEFGHQQTAEDPHDGLALFGPAETRSQMPDNIVIGTEKGVEAWNAWCDALNSSAACTDTARHRAWPPYPGFDVAFGVKWPKPVRSYVVDEQMLSEGSRKADKHDRAFSVSRLYLEQVDKVKKLDARPALAICVVPDEVFENCRPNSSVEFSKQSDIKRSADEVAFLRKAILDRDSGQQSMFDMDEPEVTAARVKIDVAHVMQLIAVLRDATGCHRSPHRARG